MEPSTKYYYRLYAANNNGRSSYSDFVEVYTAPAVPSVIGNSNVTNTSFIISWDAVPNSDRYHFQLFSDFKRTYVITEDPILTDTSILLSELVPGGTYYYRVRAINNLLSFRSEYSDMNHQTLFPTPPIALEPTDITKNSFLSHWKKN